MSAEHSFSRRQFIKGLAASSLGAGALLGTRTFGTEGLAAAITSGKAKNFVLMVSDGMNNGTFTAANHWLNLTENRDSEWMQLYKEGIATRRICETSCADSLVTDSAAASSAWGIGQRVNKGYINITPDGATPDPIALLAKAKGKSAGMVTTARITHATPAGFAASLADRDLDDAIAVQYLDRRLDLLLGGGDNHFNPAVREDGRDLYADFHKAGYEIVKSRAELQALGRRADQPLLGVFCEDHIPYCIDRQFQPELGAQNPSLEEMTEVALKRLSQNPNGFVLQVEAARVDHSAHANDPLSIIPEQLEFDRTIAVVRKFAEERGDTVVVVTSDHGTGGFMVCRSEYGYQISQQYFEGIFKCTGSYDRVQAGVNGVQDHALLVANVEKYSGVVLSEVEKESLRYALELPEKEGLYHSSRTIADALRPIFYDRFSVNWNCYHHTADLVEFGMLGPGKDALPGYIENWQVHGVVRELLGI